MWVQVERELGGAGEGPASPGIRPLGESIHKTTPVHPLLG